MRGFGVFFFQGDEGGGERCGRGSGLGEGGGRGAGGELDVAPFVVAHAGEFAPVLRRTQAALGERSVETLA